MAYSISTRSLTAASLGGLPTAPTGALYRRPPFNRYQYHRYAYRAAVAVAIALFCELCTAAEVGNLFKPVWHTVNDLDLEGNVCSASRPDVIVSCPPFGVLAVPQNKTPLSQNDIEQKCVNAGYPHCPTEQLLFPDGSCGTCPSGFAPAGDGTGDLFCENASTGEQVTFSNPFDCIKSAAYRPCYVGDTFSTATISNYYQGSDKNQEKTMSACAARLSFSAADAVRVVDDFNWPIDFPLVHLHDSHAPFGFLQCPEDPSPVYTFANFLWIFYYSVVGIGVSYFVLFALYKKIRESRLVKAHVSRTTIEDRPNAKLAAHCSTLTKGESGDAQPNQSATSSTASSSVSTDDGEASEPDDSHYTQTGYADTWTGLAGLGLVWVMSLAALAWMIIIVFDYYGFLWPLCGEEIRGACEAEEAVYSWRSGFTCGASCMFGAHWTAGTMLTWPFYNFPWGGPRIMVIFIASWHITTSWFGALILLKDRMKTLFRIKCALSEASTVEMSKRREKEIRVATDESSWENRLTDQMANLKENIFGVPMTRSLCKVALDSVGNRYFDFQCQRYTWRRTTKTFARDHFSVGDGTQTGLKAASAGLTSETATRRLESGGPNAIYVPLPSVVKAVATEFFDGFYLYQFSCLVVWFAFFYWPMGLAVGSVIVISGAIKVWTKRENQKKVKAVAESSSKISVLRDGKWCELLSDYLVPGDVIMISPNHHVIADCVLVDGRCVADESSLTGEPMPVPKIPVEASSKRFDRGPGDNKFCLLAGTTVQSVSSGESGHTLALVLATGANTDKGQLVREILYPPPMTFKFDVHWRVVFFMLIIWGIIVFFACLYMINWQLVSWFYGIFTISQIISPLVPAVFVISRARASSRLRQDASIFCVNIDRVAVAGKVKIFCFDKTGTLTKGGLDFRGVEPVVVDDNQEASFGGLTSGSEAPPRVADVLACCHELDGIPCDAAAADGDGKLTDEVVAGDGDRENAAASRPISGRWLRLRRKRDRHVCDEEEERHEAVTGGRDGLILVGNEVDRKIFISSEFELVDLSSQPVVEHRERGRKWKVLRRFEFDRDRMTMSVVVEEVTGGGEGRSSRGARFVFTKGSYESVRDVARAESVPKNFDVKTTTLAAEGYYVLAVGWRPYEGPEDVSLAERDNLECSLDLLGLLLFENRLKKDTPQVIEDLKKGSIRPVMITGDNAQTAAKIARECGLSVAKDIILGDVTDGSVVWTDMSTGKRIESLEVFKQALKTGEVELAVTGMAFNALNDIDAMNDEVVCCLEKMTCRRQQSSDSDGIGVAGDASDVLMASAPLKKTEMERLLPFMRIFARMKPQQKVEAVKMHMALGITAMCGDGANDAGALRMAHVGLALSSGATSATIVAPFSTPRASLQAATQILLEGRAALANAVAGYKNLMMYGEIMVIISLIQYYLGVILSEPFWMSMDIFINIMMAWAIMQARPSKTLSKYRPTCKLLSVEVCTSVVSQILVNTLILIIVITVLYRQDWFVCREFDANLVDPAKWWLKGDNFESVVICQIALVQFMTSAAVFNIGFDYRRKWIRNYWVVIFWLIGMAMVSFLIFADPNFFSCIFRHNCGDISLLERFAELGKISYTGPISTAPVGCPCSEQVIDSLTCEAEYTNCAADKYNQTYHHNIIPFNFRWVIFGFAVANIVFSFFIEGFVLVGPVRRSLRRRRAARNGQDLSTGGITGTGKDTDRPVSVAIAVQDDSLQAIAR